MTVIIVLIAAPGDALKHMLATTFEVNLNEPAEVKGMRM